MFYSDPFQNIVLNLLMLLESIEHQLALLLLFSAKVVYQVGFDFQLVNKLIIIPV